MGVGMMRARLCALVTHCDDQADQYRKDWRDKPVMVCQRIDTLAITKTRTYEEIAGIVRKILAGWAGEERCRDCYRFVHALASGDGKFPDCGNVNSDPDCECNRKGSFYPNDVYRYLDDTDEGAG